MNTTIDPHYKLLFGVRRSHMYHGRRRAFFERLYLAFVVSAAVLGGLAVMGAVTSLYLPAIPPDSLYWAFLLSTLLAIFALVGPMKRGAYKHWGCSGGSSICTMKCCVGMFPKPCSRSTRRPAWISRWTPPSPQGAGTYLPQRLADQGKPCLLMRQ
jgi:hypothetical protein